MTSLFQRTTRKEQVRDSDYAPRHLGFARALFKRGNNRKATEDPGLRRFMVIACGDDDTTAVDLRSGAVTRLRIDWPKHMRPGFAAFELIDAAVRSDDGFEDLAHPEAIWVEGVPQSVGSMAPRKARRVLRDLVAPQETHLLGITGAAAPYWEFKGMQPSVAVVVPSRGPLLFRRRADDSVWARFGWTRSDNWLPVEDRRAIAALWASGRERLYGKDLANALGFRPQYVVVTLSPPRNGHCYKTVAALLPRP